MSHTGLEVAIIGMAGRFPGARDVETFWHNVRNGVESITAFSPQELEAAGVDSAVLRLPSYVPAGAVLDDIDRFDAAFFGLTPRDAEILDPQHRIFLECAWEALEHAGCAVESYRGLIGIYGGCGTNTYYLHNLASNPELLEVAGGFQLGISNDKDFLCPRVAYLLRLTGPSVTVQSACSTSLVAVHLACQGLLSGECDVALAGGVSIAATGKSGYLYEEGGILSNDGHCRAFDARALGTVGGSGAAIVVLKRLSDALDDGDLVHAVIRGSAINNDGAQRVGFTAPGVQGQARVIRAAQALAEVAPDAITYVEAHGTATRLGDPIEVAALTQAFRAGTARRQFCALGSVKSNVGHLDAAAGVTGLLKTVLALEHREIPPSLHFERPNPECDFEASPFYVSSTLAAWASDAGPRRAGVSSFGLGGTNAHVIVEEAPPAPGPGPSRPHQLLLLSARTSTALETAAQDLARWLRAHPDANLADVASTLQLGRHTFAERLAVVASTPDEAAAALESLDPRRVLAGACAPEAGDRPVAFMFPGGGSQHPNMGRELYRTEAVFREQIDRCAAALAPLLELELRDVLYPDDDLAGAAHRLMQPDVALPALFVTEYALARLWMSWGVRPRALIGHSLGEYVAACIAGVFSLEDALALTVVRGRLMSQIPSGGMLVVELPEAELGSILRPGLSCAAVNGPSQCVLSGPGPLLEEVARPLDARGVRVHRVAIDVAAHSELVAEVVPAFRDFVAKLDLHAPDLPLVSNVTGTWIEPGEAIDPAYWARHLRETVRFADGLGALLRDAPETVLLEVGPGHALSALAGLQERRPAPGAVLSSLPHPSDPRPAGAVVLASLGQLWTQGVRGDGKAFWAGQQRRRVPLPTYPFERQRYWIEPGPADRPGGASYGSRRSPDRRAALRDFFYLPSWKRTMPPPHAAARSLAGPRRRWLVFVDRLGLGERLAASLRDLGHEVICASVGDRSGALDADRHVFDPRDPAPYFELFEHLREQRRLPDRIVHAMGLLRGDRSLEEAREAGYESLISIAQAVHHHASGVPLRLDVLANRLHDVTGADEIDPWQVAVLGPCKVIPQEHPEVSCRCIDLGDPGADLDSTAALVLAELATDPVDPVVAYRGRQRWVQTFEAVRIDDATPRARELRPNGVYMITGGLGRIGRFLAGKLAETLKARLVLVSRTGLPDRGDWERWLREPDAHPSSAGIRAVQSLEELGAEVLVISADVCDPAAMAAAVDQAVARFGALHGVIHAAGVTTGTSIRCPVHELTREDSDRQLGPKVAGVHALAQALRGRELDFCLLFSSNAAVLGGLGFTAYAAANLGMDAFAALQSRRGSVPWISATWDGWPGATDDTARSSIDRFALSPAEAFEAFLCVVCKVTAGQVTVSAGDLQARLDIWIRRAAAGAGRGPDGDGDRARLHPRPPLGNRYLAPVGAVEQRIAEVWEGLLGIEQIGRHDNFFTLGGHSLLATQLVSRLRSTFQVELPLRRVFEAPTVADLAEAVTLTLNEARDRGGLDEIVREIEALSTQDVESALSELAQEDAPE